MSYLSGKCNDCASFYKEYNYEPRHDKTNAVWSGFMLLAISFSTCNRVGKRTAWIQTRLRGCAGWSRSMLVANALCWFCHYAAHIKNKYSWPYLQDTVRCLRRTKSWTTIFCKKKKIFLIHHMSSLSCLSKINDSFNYLYRENLVRVYIPCTMIQSLHQSWKQNDYVSKYKTRYIIKSLVVF
jgi:hypothetical protein